MIHTIYCNVYEGLEAALAENVFQDLEAMAGDPSRIFEKIEIIPASSAIEDRLARSLADKFSILPGIRFCSIFDWLTFHGCNLPSRLHRHFVGLADLEYPQKPKIL
ncbi:hypothetical protein [Turicimonas muris]|uniref:hypothetical protein n=1 Tax=Turicimonas muris TaxID=1796652 RepID=UPI0032203EC1